jgi:hypothetical protein
MTSGGDVHVVAGVALPGLQYGAAPLLYVDEDPRLAGSACCWRSVCGERDEQRSAGVNGQAGIEPAIAPVVQKPRAVATSAPSTFTT